MLKRVSNPFFLFIALEVVLGLLTGNQISPLVRLLAILIISVSCYTRGWAQAQPIPWYYRPRGLYKIIRHPQYLGELGVILGFGILYLVVWQIAAVMVLASFYYWIVVYRLEWKLLNTFQAYADYALRTTWRLVPGVF